MSDTEASGEAGPLPVVATAAVVPTPAPAQQYVPANLPLPAPLEYKGDVYSNWKYFKLQWEDYETATQLCMRSQVMRMATLVQLWEKSAHGYTTIWIFQKRTKKMCQKL